MSKGWGIHDLTEAYAEGWGIHDLLIQVQQCHMTRLESLSLTTLP